MRNFIRSFAVILVMAGAMPAFASSAFSFAPRISIALPTQQIDFSDLDMRDEFNRPISAPVIRERFEQQLARELNRLLIENLTPLRRAWLDLLDVAESASRESLNGIHRRSIDAAAVIFRGNPMLSLLVRQGSVSAFHAPAAFTASGETGSFFLALQLISTTRLLR